MNKKTYSQHIKCTNCHFESSHPNNIAEIPVGTTFGEWASKNPCPNCGCYELTKN